MAKRRFTVPQYHRHESGSQPDWLYPAYRATIARSPRKPLILLPHSLSEVTGPVYGSGDIAESDNDLTRQHFRRTPG